MSLFFRKSLKLGPIRLNLGKSGIGVSAGIKGLRVGTGPRGNYVSAGKGGIYYRKTFPGTQGHVLNTATPASIESAALSPPGHAKRKLIWFFIAVISAAACWLMAIGGASRDTVGAIVASAIALGLIVWVARRRMRADEVEQPSNSDREPLAASSSPNGQLNQVQSKALDATMFLSTKKGKKPTLPGGGEKEKKEKAIPGQPNHPGTRRITRFQVSIYLTPTTPKAVRRRIQRSWSGSSRS